MKKFDLQNKTKKVANGINGSPHSSGRLEREPSALISLSPRQLEIAQLIARGLSDKEIANELHLTEGTVGWHLDGIFKKWGIHSRTRLVAQLVMSAPANSVPKLP